MPAKSKSQQHFMGMVYAYQKGEMKDASPAVKKAAKSMTKKAAKDFASTKTKGLPKKVKEGEMSFTEFLILEQDVQEGLMDALRFAKGMDKKVSSNIHLDSVIKNFGEVFDKHMIHAIKAGKLNVGAQARKPAMDMSKMSAPMPAAPKKSAMDMSKLAAPAPASAAPAPAPKRELELEPLDSEQPRRRTLGPRRSNVRRVAPTPKKRQYRDFDEIPQNRIVMPESILDGIMEGIFKGVWQAGHDEVFNASKAKLDKLAQTIVAAIKSGQISWDDAEDLLSRNTSNFGNARAYLLAQLKRAGYNPA